MIRIQKGAEPQILKDNQVQWTADLMALVKKYGGYGRIPTAEKNAAIRYYRDHEIADALKGNSANAKCIYCESFVDVTSYANIEHFHPKSIYPEETFCWDNLFIGCTRCNTPKNNFDTAKMPFIHPEKEKPEDFLTFEDIMYAPKYKDGEPYEKAKNVIDACELRRTSLIQAHATILLNFRKACEALSERMQQYETHKSLSAKQKDAVTIYGSLVTLRTEAKDDAQYAGFMRYLLRKSEEIRDAVLIVNSHKEALGLNNDFDWGFS